eukprot:TCONS_00069736-protein
MIHQSCFGHPDRTTGGNSICECPVLLHQTLTILNAPSILVITIGRGYHNENTGVKRVMIEEKLEFKVFFANSLNGISYRLLSMTNHTGKNMLEGHFTATIFDDQIVTINDTKI